MASSPAGPTPTAISVLSAGPPGVLNLAYGLAINPSGPFTASHWSGLVAGTPTAPISAVRAFSGDGINLAFAAPAASITQVTYDGAEPGLTAGGIAPAPFSLSVPFP